MSLIDEARTVRERIVARLAELEPLVREYMELKQLASEMGLDVQPLPVEPPREPLPREPPPLEPLPVDPTPSPSAAPRPQRRTAGARGRSTGPAEAPDIAERVLAAVGEQPGKTVAEYAEMLGLNPTSLYRPVRELTSDGRLVKRARQLFLPD